MPMINLRPIEHRSKARARRDELPRVQWSWRMFWCSMAVGALWWLGLVHLTHWLYMRVM